MVSREYQWRLKRTQWIFLMMTPYWNNVIHALKSNFNQWPQIGSCKNTTDARNETIQLTVWFLVQQSHRKSNHLLAVRTSMQNLTIIITNQHLSGLDKRINSIEIHTSVCWIEAFPISEEDTVTDAKADTFEKEHRDKIFPKSKRMVKDHYTYIHEH